ncbi:MAG: glycosyltransferase family protein, partial [Lachnospira sp.]|nr:glycosyltransferase family protein [Lachnospira sp.]
MDDKKFAFIMCVNDEDMAAEALYYISRLDIPEGYSLEDIEVVDATSMTSGYNEGMKASDAKYKIYLHQDVMIVNKRFLYEVLDIFKDPKIGMFGCVGSPKMPENKILWKSRAVGASYHSNNYETFMSIFDNEKKKYMEVEALDG